MDENQVIERGTLEWKVNFPGLINELIMNDANLKSIGAGAAYGLALTLIYLENIAKLAIRDNHQGILDQLERLGLVSLDEEK